MKMWRRKRAPTSIADALSEIVSRTLVTEALEQVPLAYLIETIAQDTFQSSDELLCRVAEMLGLKAITEVTIPEPDLVHSLGYEVDRLQSLHVLPQVSITAPTGRALLIADPTLVSISEFEACGVPVFLALGGKIASRWIDFLELQRKPKRQLSDAQVIALIEQLVSMGESHNISSLTLGEPQPGMYQFHCRGKVYSGSILPAAISEIIAQAKVAPTFAVEIQGLTFSVTIDIRQSDESPIAMLSWCAAGKSAVGVPTTKKRERQIVTPKQIVRSCTDKPLLMIVDDDHRFSFILRRVLESKGFRVSMQTSPEAALDELERGTIIPDLIVCDVHMPVLDGPTFIREFQKLNTGTPCIMLTSDSDQLLEAEAIMLGVDAYVRKQDDPCVLLAWVTSLLKRTRVSDNIRSSIQENVRAEGACHIA